MFPHAADMLGDTVRRGPRKAYTARHPMEVETIRHTMLQIVDDLSGQDTGSLQKGTVLHEVARKLNLQRADVSTGQAVLTVWHDLIRTGYLAPGHDLLNCDLPFCHVTKLGRETLSNLSRDPGNTEGYLRHWEQLGASDTVGRSYLHEALRCYNTGCFKASAVMLGGAAERLIICLRDRLVERFESTKRQVPGSMNAWKIKTITDAITNELKKHVGDMGRPLREAFESNWGSFCHLLRTSRNDAGHPISIEPVTADQAHASLLVFPYLTQLIVDIESWVERHYSN